MRVRKVLEETKLGNILFFFFQKWNCRKSDFQGSKSQPLSAAFVYKETEKKKEEEEEEGGRVVGWANRPTSPYQSRQHIWFQLLCPSGEQAAINK